MELGDLQQVSLLGTGHVGSVFFCRHKSSGERYGAHCDAALLQCSTHGTGAPAALKKIPREAAQPPRIFAEKAALSAVLHLNVVKFYKVMLLCSA